MFPPVFRLLICCGLLFSLSGGHWGLLQTIAWSGMAVNYTQEAGLAKGLADTFSGKRPCNLCEKISQSRQQEQEREAPRAQAEFVLTAVLSPVGTPINSSSLLGCEAWSAAGDSAVLALTPVPETPPPRC